jgi:putative oxidoreductase
MPMNVPVWFSSSRRVGALVCDAFGDLLLLFFRVCWGWQFCETGWGKLGNIQRVISYFKELGIPAPELNARFVGGLECIGGLLLVVGLGARPVATLLTISMTVAYVKADSDKFDSFEHFAAATPFWFLLTTVLVVAFGPGRLSLDWLLFGRKRAAAAADAAAHAHVSADVTAP